MDIRLSGSPGEIRAALLTHDTLVDVALWRPGAPDGWGDVHAVRVTHHASALDGAFVQLASGEEGFLTTRKKLPEGHALCAEVVRAAQNGKGLRLKPIRSVKQFPHTHVPSLLQRGRSPLEEMAHNAPNAPLLVDDMAIVSYIPSHLRHRIRRVSQSFDDILENEWDELSAPTVSLGALKAHITVTPALTAIDLDSSATPDFKTNIEHFGSLLHHIRLRNLSGIILIDPAGIKSRKRPALVPFLREAVAQSHDPLEPRVTGITPAGLLEITRPRRRPPLQELLTSPHGQALSILKQILRENRKGSTLHAPPAIINALENDPIALKDFTLIYGHSLQLKATSSSPASSIPWSLS